MPASTAPTDRPERVFRYGKWLLLGLLVGAALLLAWRIMGPLPVQVAHPSRGAAVQAVYATGNVEASVTVRIAPQLGGRMVALLAREGEVVESGQVLARLDVSDLQASLREARAQQSLAESRLRRLQALDKSDFVSRDQLDEARATVASARAAVQRLEEQIKFMTLRAPVDGRIIRRDGEVGDFIPVNQPVFYLTQLNVPLRVTAEVDEEDIAGVRIGQRALITADAFPGKVFEGRVTEITPMGDPVARNYRVRIDLPAGTTLMIGMTTEVNIIQVTHDHALLVPTASLRGDRLWLARDGRAVLQPVQLGIKGLQRTEILQGLNDNDEVILQPPADLAVGDRLRVESAPAPGSDK